MEDGPQVSSEKATREESEKLKEAEMEVDEVPQEESVEIVQKRKLIRVETEETQDCVRETLALSQEEAEALGFVPLAVSELRGPTCWCDNRCSESLCRLFARTAIVSLWMTTFGGYRRETKTATTDRRSHAVGVVVRCSWRPIRMESASQDIGGTDRCQC